MTLDETLAFLRKEKDGVHGESERRVAAEFALDALDGDVDCGDDPAGYAADCLESLAAACMSTAERLRPPGADEAGDFPEAVG